MLCPTQENGEPAEALYEGRLQAERRPIIAEGTDDMQALKACVNTKEKAVVQWVVANHHRAGACTHMLPDAAAMYLPVQDAEEVKGVMGILLEERRPIRDFEYGLLIAMLNETGVKLQDKL